MKIRKNIILLMCTVLISAVAMLAVANTVTLKSWLGVVPAEALLEEEEPSGKKDPQQEALLQEMSALLKPFDTTNISYYLSGKLTAIDRADSAHALYDIPYQFGKWDQEMYMRMGETEMFNTKELNIYIDHAAKKIILAPHKKVMYSPGFAFDKLYEFVRSEGFTVSKKSLEGKIKEISIESPNHISLKAVTLTYDTLSRELKKIHTRQAAITDPLNEQMEKWITMAIDSWNEDPAAASYLNIKKIIEQKQGQWYCTEAYKEYDLIDRYLQ